MSHHTILLFFFFNDPAPTEIYTLSLHDALPILPFPFTGDWARYEFPADSGRSGLLTQTSMLAMFSHPGRSSRSEEHTSELQSRQYLVCRLLLEKKKKTTTHKV